MSLYRALCLSNDIAGIVSQQEFNLAGLQNPVMPGLILVLE